MARVKGGPRAHKRHKKVLKLAKGYSESRSKLYKRANEAVLRAGEHAFSGRKERKRQMRRTWITRINGALTAHDVKYSRFIKGLKDAKIDLNRKMLSDLAIQDPNTFEKVVAKVKATFK
ncbi:50S ribosomal protein L20 [candidate division WWE3 bacterium]|jgi:large subunit ribosomal protein L20|nr:50S ribosomal protein L20 [candidate division WWE3 bacterium]MBT7349231.1 50S ribosomal protein L20 [candidate division WWE3 bacterium]